MSLRILPSSSPGLSRLAWILALTTFIGTVAFLVRDESTSGTEDSGAVYAQTYENQVQVCRENAGSNVSACVAEADKSYRASADQVYQSPWSETLVAWGIYAVIGLFLSLLAFLAARMIGYVSGRFSPVANTLDPGPRRLSLGFTAPMPLDFHNCYARRDDVRTLEKSDVEDHAVGFESLHHSL
jgi:hypothetical protein